jgi:hypothetical protein
MGMIAYGDIISKQFKMIFGKKECNFRITGHDANRLNDWKLGNRWLWFNHLYWFQDTCYHKRDLLANLNFTYHGVFGKNI